MAQADRLEGVAAVLAAGGASGDAQPELVAGTLMIPGSAKAGEVSVTELRRSRQGFAGGSTSRLPVPADGQPDWTVHDAVAKVLAVVPTTGPNAGGHLHTSGADVGFGLAHECGECHEDTYKAWQEHPHGRAMATLGDEKKAGDESCLACHSEHFRRTGEAPPAGMRSEGVQCAACHGDGLLHALTGRAELAEAKPEAATCIACHTRERSPEFDAETYWGRLSH